MPSEKSCAAWYLTVREVSRVKRNLICHILLLKDVHVSLAGVQYLCEDFRWNVRLRPRRNNIKGVGCIVSVLDSCIALQNLLSQSSSNKSGLRRLGISDSRLIRVSKMSVNKRVKSRILTFGTEGLFFGGLPRPRFTGGSEPEVGDPAPESSAIDLRFLEADVPW